METKRNRRLLLLLILCSVLFSQTVAWLPLGDPSAVGIPYEGAKQHDQPPLEADTDILQNAQLKIMRNARQADAVFTNDYSSLLGQISSKKYLESPIGEWVSGALVYHRPVKRQSDAIFTDLYTRLRKKLAEKKYLNSLLSGNPR